MAPLVLPSNVSRCTNFSMSWRQRRPKTLGTSLDSSMSGVLSPWKLHLIRRERESTTTAVHNGANPSKTPRLGRGVTDSRCEGSDLVNNWSRKVDRAFDHCDSFIGFLERLSVP